ncbi:hypothetical protein GGI07_002263 [Coemansia sp. Benny D115]|nr:hypothetical protein GGI07_002263 [Coemansia sp. Benny D115]
MTHSIHLSTQKFHPAIRLDPTRLLDISSRKLQALRQPVVSLRRIVLIHNMYRSILAPTANVPMEVEEADEEGARAEQSWFDSCLDSVLAEDMPQAECSMEDSDSDGDDDEEYDAVLLRRSSSTQSMQELVNKSKTPAEKPCDNGSEPLFYSSTFTLPRGWSLVN